MPLILVALLLALVLSAFFTAAELAVFSLGDARVRTLVDRQFRGSGALARIRAHPERLLVLLRLGNAAADVTAATSAAALAYLTWNMVGLAVAAGIAALLLLLLVELVPLGLAAQHRVRIALIISPPLLLVQEAVGPVLRPFERLAQRRAEPSNASADPGLESEIRQITALGRTEGTIEEHERQLVERALRLDETRAWDIMTPRVDIFAWPDSRTLAAITTELRTVPYSRVPVYGESIDDVTGVLYVRDAYQALVSGQRDVPLRALAREPLIVPGSVPLTKLLRDFQTRCIHLALVVDEYGGIDGLVTLEDVLEELVGEIVDETDVAEEPITRISRSEIVAAGDADLREINHFFNASLPQLEHRSLNGYLLEELGRVPEPGECVHRDGIMVEVLEATETQVVRARLRRVGPPSEPVGGVAGAQHAEADRPRPQPPPEAGGNGRPAAAEPRGRPARPSEETASFKST